jgi:hypothetical protein
MLGDQGTIRAIRVICGETAGKRGQTLMSVVVCILLEGSWFTLYPDPLPAKSFFFLHGAQAVLFGSVSASARQAIRQGNTPVLCLDCNGKN